MGLTGILKSAFFGYLLWGNPQAVAEHFPSIGPAKSSGSSGAFDEPGGFCPARNLSFYDPSYSQLSEDFFTQREVEPVDTSFAFEPSPAKQESWGGRVSKLASTIHDYTCQLIWPR